MSNIAKIHGEPAQRPLYLIVYQDDYAEDYRSSRPDRILVYTEEESVQDWLDALLPKHPTDAYGGLKVKKLTTNTLGVKKVDVTDQFNVGKAK